MPGPDRSNTPLVGVIVPVFNRLELLRETVSSLRAQTLSNAEFILVDDDSEAPVWEFLQTLPAKDKRFRVIRKPAGLPKGPQASRNIGLEATRAEAVLMLDSDDLLAPRCLEERFSALSASPASDALVGRQAIVSEATGRVQWVNVPKPFRSDLDRFLEITHPLDVPWVNGGVLIRVASLRSREIRYRPEFTWDDVAFHFECLISGFKVTWMPYDSPPDAYYRHHVGETRGLALSTSWGMRNAAEMFDWMHQRLEAAGQLNESRRRALARSFFKACVLPALDAADFALASDLTEKAARNGVLTARNASSIRRYRLGRSLFRRLPRITYYWNRLSDRSLLAPFISDEVSTYGSIPAEPGIASETHGRKA